MSVGNQHAQICIPSAKREKSLSLLGDLGDIRAFDHPLMAERGIFFHRVMESFWRFSDYIFAGSNNLVGHILRER